MNRTFVQKLTVFCINHYTNFPYNDISGFTCMSRHAHLFTHYNISVNYNATLFDSQSKSHKIGNIIFRRKQASQNAFS